MRVRSMALVASWVVAVAWVVAGCEGGPGSSVGATATAVGPAASLTPAPPSAIVGPSPSEVPSMTPPESSPISTFTLTSPAFDADGSIPSRFTCDGQDISPPLAWSGAPDGTVAFLLTIRDPDAGGFLHWIAWNLPVDADGLAAGASGDLPREAGEGRTDFGGSRRGYRGPCPPSGTHRYVVTLYALPMALADADAAPTDRLERAANEIALGRATLTGTYRRR